MTSNEIDLLKDRADMMGISYHPSIGVAKLKEKINAILENRTAITVEEEESEVPREVQEDEQVLIQKAYVPETPAQRNARSRKEAHKLVRVRITCMNPDKKNWKGEFFNVGNSVIGMTNKFVPYNIESDEGYHVPNIILGYLKEKQFRQTVTTKLPNGKVRKSNKLSREFAIEILEPLTPEALKELATRQALNHSID